MQGPLFSIPTKLTDLDKGELFMKTLKTENQNTVTAIGKDFCVYTHRRQGGISFQLGHAAMKDLSNEAFVLYMCMLMRPQNEPLTFCDNSLRVRTKLTQETLDNAKQELLEKSYLTPSKDEELPEALRAMTYDLWEEPSLRMMKAS